MGTSNRERFKKPYRHRISRKSNPQKGMEKFSKGATDWYEGEDDTLTRHGLITRWAPLQDPALGILADNLQRPPSAIVARYGYLKQQVIIKQATDDTRKKLIATLARNMKNKSTPKKG